MRKSPFVAGFSTALALAGLLAACGKTAEPGPTAPGPTAPASPGVPASVTSVEIVGPRSVAPGQTIQFTAVARRSDGTTLDVTNTAVWQAFPGAALSISAPGLVTGRALGESFIQVQSSNRFSSKEIVVVPTGTYRLVGLVGELDVPTAPVVGARVEVTGATVVPFATTAADGRYRLYGVSGNVQIRLSKDGYEPFVQNVLVSDHQTQNFAMTLTRPRAEVAGTYTLTVTAAGDCSATLPEQARIRTYTAVVTQVGPDLDVTLTGPTFALSRNGKGNRFRGRIEPRQVVFTLSPYNTYYYFYYGTYVDIMEQLTTSLYLAVTGSVVATITTSRLSGPLDGSLLTYTRDPRRSPLPDHAAECRSANHQFALSR